MPRGARPKVYEPATVQAVAQGYADGLTQSEVAVSLGLTQKVVWNVMRRHGIAARPAVKRDQAGPANATWKGDAVDYAGAHRRVERERGRPQRCDDCGTDAPRRYEWANLTGRYHDVTDYRRMCVPCHRAYDAARRGGDA